MLEFKKHKLDKILPSPFDPRDIYFSNKMCSTISLPDSIDLACRIKRIENQQNLGIEGEYWVREDGCKMYGDYIICAADLNVHSRGSLVESSLGTCIVLDTGGFATNGSGVALDIAVDW